MSCSYILDAVVGCLRKAGVVLPALRLEWKRRYAILLPFSFLIPICN
jgi:hypothetical protein